MAQFWLRLGSGGVSPGWVGSPWDARLRASFLACFSIRRSRSLASRASLANVVFRLPLEAIAAPPSSWEFHRRARAPGCHWSRSQSAPPDPTASRAPRRGPWARDPRRLEHAHVGCGRALWTLLGVVGHLCALRQRPKAVSGDRGLMDEQVLVAFIRRDEPVALLVAEPLHGSRCHFIPPRDLVRCETREVLEQQLRTRAQLCRARCPAEVRSLARQTASA